VIAGARQIGELVGVVSHGRTRSESLRLVAGAARAVADRVATNTVGAVARRAFSIRSAAVALRREGHRWRGWIGSAAEVMPLGSGRR